MVIYADVIFFVNFISSYILLYALVRVINKKQQKTIRLILASLLSSGISVLVFCFEIPMWLSYVMRTLTVFIMISIAAMDFRKNILQQSIWFAFMTGIMMFMVTFIVSVSGKKVAVALKNGIMYFDIPIGTFIIAFILSYLCMTFFIKMFKNRNNKKYYIMSLTHNGKKIDITALFDSGNMLKEPVTGKCVSIVEWNKAKTLFDADFDFSELQEHIEDMKLWVIPFNSIGNPSGILFAFMADSLSIPEEKKVVHNTFIGLYDKSLSKNEEYHALINAGLL